MEKRFVPPSREWKFRVEDILNSIESIFEYISGMDFEQFANDPKTRDAVVLNLAIMGEAARHVPNEIKDLYSEIEWNEMIANRNVMIHVYFGLKPRILWDSIQRDLPPLKEQLKLLLNQES